VGVVSRVKDSGPWEGVPPPKGNEQGLICGGVVPADSAAEHGRALPPSRRAAAPPPPQVGVTRFGSFEVEVVDPIEDYLALLKEVFDFPALR
jgi:hypothetical protein